MATKKAATKKAVIKASSTKLTAAELMAEVNAAMKANVIVMGSDPSLEVTYIPTNFLPIDILFQGGIPRGRMVEIFGDFSTLKSVIGLYAIASIQKSGGTAALIDTEHAYDPEWAEKIGVDTSTLIIWPNREDDEHHSGEEAFDVAQTLCRKGVDLIVFDSIAAAMPEAESEKPLKGEKVQPARLAQLMSTALRRLTMTNQNTAFIFINQLRMNIGITFGSAETTTGGKAMPFYASYRLQIRKTGKVTKDVQVWKGTKWEKAKEQIGQMYTASLVKSKLSKPFVEQWFTWDLETGQMDLPDYLLATGIALGIIKVQGNTHTYLNLRSVGRPNFKKKLAADFDAMRALETEVREYYGLPTSHLSSPVPLRKRIRRA